MVYGMMLDVIAVATAISSVPIICHCVYHESICTAHAKLYLRSRYLSSIYPNASIYVYLVYVYF
jgi:hypothetical protein